MVISFDANRGSTQSPAMQPQPGPPLSRSLSFRFALLYGLVFAASSAGLIGVMDFTTISSLTKQRDVAISAELRELLIKATASGIAQLEREIAERDNAPSKSQFLYALYDGTNRRLAGSPLQFPRANGWRNVRSATGDPDDLIHIVHLRSAMLPGGYLLAVGEDTDLIDDLREFLSPAFALGIGAALLLALGGGLFLSRLFRLRLDRIAAVCREIVTGNLSLRVPVRRSGDEIDVLAASMNTMLDRIGALMETLRQVSVDIAHDLGTPLTRIRQTLETTDLTAKTVEEYSGAVRKTLGQVDTILDTFAALLRIAELEAGALRSRFESVSLSQIMQTVADAYLPPAEENSQRIISDIAPDVYVNGDESLLTQLFANLVANALRHTPQGTTVRMELLVDDAGRAVAFVSDDGPGIPEADRLRVLQRFVRLERSRTTPGSGLGLSLCAAIAELHGARFELQDNAPGLRCRLVF